MPRIWSLRAWPPTGFLTITVLGLLLAAWGLVWPHPLPGFLGLGLSLAGSLGLWARLAFLQREVSQRESLLLDLNRSLDDQVKARTIRLMQTIEDLESFNRMITHDLHSPLTALMTGAELLKYKLGLGLMDDFLPLLESLEESAIRMKDLIEGLRELALISGRLPSVQPVDVSHYSDLVLNQLHLREPHRQVQWQIDPGLTVLGDPNLLRIGLENLLGNAWKYSAASLPAIINVRRGEGSGNVIEIQDNGLGFDMAQVEMLFKPFQRLHSDRKIPGHGIGLSIVKRVMTKHGGKITAQGTPGQGATFRLEFPAELELSKSEAPAR